MILEPPTFNHLPNPLSSMTHVPPIQSSTYTTHNNSTLYNNNENNDQNININESEKSKKSELEERIDDNKEFDNQSNTRQISENDVVDNKINESSYFDFTCSPGDFIIVLGSMNEKMNMGRNRANLDDNYFNLGLIGQEFNGKLGFWKSELCDSNTVFACVCKCVWIIAFVWDCMYVYMRVGMYVRVCVCVCACSLS